MSERKEKFTPGPWDAECVATQVGHCWKVGKFPSDNRNGETMACIYMDFTSPTGKAGIELSANAHLIAAAPELYEALEGVLRVADRQTAEFDAARAALAKARGEA